MIPGENDVPPVRDDVPPIVENPVTLPPIPDYSPEPVAPWPGIPREDLPAPPGLKPEAPYIKQELPRPKFPQVGRIPQEPFQITSSSRSIPSSPLHSFWGEASSVGVTIWPGLLVTYIEGSVGGTAVQEVWQPSGLTTDPLFVSAGDGDIICLKWDITALVVSNVRVEVGTPGLVSATIGGTSAVEIGTVTSDGFTQKLRSDFFYTSIYPNDPP
jgi:hypothetical protein